MNTIIVAGGTGFVGSAVVRYYLDRHWHVQVITRDKQKAISKFKNDVTPIEWQTFSDNSQDFLSQANAIVNLSGANVAKKRWTKKRKQELRESRTRATEIITSACAVLGEESPVFLNGTAISIYALQDRLQNAPHETEYSELPHGDSLPSIVQLCEDIEELSCEATDAGVRVVNLRIAPPLSNEGGIMAMLLPSFRKGLGAIMGLGEEPFDWIHMDDLTRAIDFIIKQNSIKGGVNLIAPNVVTQANFAQMLAKLIDKPCRLKMPAWLLKLLMGQMASELILRGVNAEPKILLEHDFEFKFPTLEKALNNLVVVK